MLHVEESSVDQHIFPDGERRVRITDKVVDELAVVVQSAYPPVDINYVELFFLIDAVKRSGAEFVTAVVPYFGYQRQDHIFRDGEAVSLEVMIRILESLGVSTLVSVDMHSVKIPNLFHIPVQHVSALSVFAEKIRSLGMEKSDTILVSPDLGGIARIKKLSNLLDDMPYVSLQKNRDLETGDLTIDAIQDGGSLTGKKRAILVDDMISTGNTVILGAQFLKKQGVKDIFVFATHPVFAKDAPQLLQQSTIAKFFVTDTVSVPKEKQFQKLTILSVAPLLAEAIRF